MFAAGQFVCAGLDTKVRRVARAPYREVGRGAARRHTE